MTEELSRKIAEHLEPLSTLPSDDADKQDMDSFPTECWLSTFRLSHVTGMHVPAWEPRDMVHDPAMTAMLLENMGRRGLVQVYFRKTENLWCCGFDFKVSGGKTIGEAVARAFCRMEGLI